MDMAADRLVLSYLLGEVISRTVFTPYQQLLTEVQWTILFQIKSNYIFLSLAITPSRAKYIRATIIGKIIIKFQSVNMFYLICYSFS